VIATTAGAIPEVVRDGAEAILVSPGDERALTEALRRVEADRGRVAAMQIQALARSHTLPRWRDTQARFAEMLIAISDGSA
ncbi:MAG: glycosyltransferase family 1 protein, partial [Minicystis sp.]